MSKMLWLQSKRMRIACVVTLYFVVSIALVFSNKLLLSNADPSHPTTIPAPLFVTFFQCVLTAVIIWVLGVLNQWVNASTSYLPLATSSASASAASSSSSSTPPPANSYLSTCLMEFPLPQYKASVARNILPLSVMFIGMITFNNLCLQYVEVSFYNVARSLTIVINVVFTYLILGESTSMKTCGCLLVVIVGFFVGSEGEVNFTWLGTFYGVLSSAFVSLNAIYTKKLMPFVDNDKWKLAFYNNVNASLMFLPLMVLFGEQHILYRYRALLVDTMFWTVMMIAGVLGFAIGIVTVMQINVTSPLTHNISGTAKACVQTVLALVIWRNPTTVNSMLGVAAVIIGTMLYAYVRNNEMEAQKASQKSAAAMPTPAPSSPPSVTSPSPAPSGTGSVSGGGGGGFSIHINAPPAAASSKVEITTLHPHPPAPPPSSASLPASSIPPGGAPSASS